MNANQVEPGNGSDIVKTLGIPSLSKRPRRVKRYTAWGIAILLAVLAAGRLMSAGGNDAPRYKTQPATRGDLSVTVTATGTLDPTNQVDVGCELSGTVQFVDVDYNWHVKKGQVLARLDTDKLRAQALQSKASLQSAKAKLLQAQATVRESQSRLSRLKHLAGLSGNKAVSQYDLESADATLARSAADVENCKAEVARNKALLEANETDLSKALIRSPINGIVLTRSIEPGQTVAAAMTTPVLFTLAEDLTKMKLLVDVDEADVGEVNEGQEAAFAVDAYQNRKFPARIIQVRYGAKTKNSVVTYKAVLLVDNSDMSLRPGMTATAEITVKKIENALLVPNAALRFTPPVEEKKEDAVNGTGIMSKLLPHPPPPPGGKRAESTNVAGKTARVWVLRDNRPVAVPVVTGATDGTFTVVRSGELEPDTALIVDSVSAKR